MTTRAQTRNTVVHTTSAGTRRHTVFVSSAIIGMSIGVSFLLFVTSNHFSGDDIDMLRILSAAFAPSIVGLVLALFGSVLPDSGKQ